MASQKSLNVPPSQSTVRVRMLDTTALLTVKSESFVQPVLPGHELMNITDVAFLVDHKESGRRVLFDAGVRKDYWNLPPVIQKRLGDVIPGLKVEQDVTEVLREAGIELGTIDTVIWSHYHWDHTGNISLFPPSTSILVGPGFKAQTNLLPGYPEKANSPISASDFKDRTLNELSFPASPLTIGGFRANDFFADGSLYLLDTPGHCPAHICALARTSTSPDTFILLGGDICHFVGDFRPNPTYPLPDPIPDGVLDEDPYFPSPCPCSLFTDLHPNNTSPASNPRTTPFYVVTDHAKSAYTDPETARESVAKLQASFDEAPNVLVCIAHDSTLLDGELPIVNKDPEGDLNDWFQKGWKQNPKLYCDWLNELPRDGKPGRMPVVEGLWKDGKRWDRDASIRKMEAEREKEREEKL